MRILFYSSFILPTIYIAGVLSFFIGLPFGFDPAEFITPYNNQVMIAIGLLTFGFVATCLIILWLGDTRIRTKALWSVLLFLGNMLAVPYFLWRSARGTIDEIRAPGKKKF
jgi:hypothetical protein